MEYKKLGHTGLDISPICLGTMGFGKDKGEWIHQWVLDETKSKQIVKHALDLGINFFDTANVYTNGSSEEFLGRALKAYAKRDEIVLATKVFNPMANKPNRAGLSRKAILTEIDNSLRRLETDYIDLYIIHRWDYQTPIEETMQVLDDLVRMGKVRYIGASAMYAWQFQKANHVASQNGCTSFVSMQNHLNLLYREEEREMLPYCADAKIAVTPYSPLAAGRLARTLNAETPRYQTDFIARAKYDTTMETDNEIVKRVNELANNYQIAPATVSLAWLLNKPEVAAPIVGATKTTYLDDAVAAIDFKLTIDDIAYLEEPYVPHQVMGPQ
ncbi:aldo/keto reductase [Fundicoccus sp. Sow4_D5]|uniref:aldo/keto reductase n=1 Tax=unclassified Fundicoccus TaxID=2761543 RepID=UPI003F9320B5